MIRELRMATLAGGNVQSPHSPNATEYGRIMSPSREKTCLRKFACNKGADQPAHPRRLISAFVIRLYTTYQFAAAQERHTKNVQPHDSMITLK